MIMIIDDNDYHSLKVQINTEGVIEDEKMEIINGFISNLNHSWSLWFK